ncbi:MAG: ATP-binding protein [Chlamydiia bacterium]|nr:ATP-binding protein [Chlamydiia bacterium]
MNSYSESQASELKKSLADPNGIGATLCGFLNCQEVARLVIGVSPQGKRLGIHVADKTQQEIANIIRQIEPCPTIEMAIEPLDSEKSIVTLKTISNLENSAK